MRRLLALAAAMFVLTSSVASAAANPSAVAVIVGNKAYANAPEIAFADRDAKAMQLYVVDVLGYDPSNVIMAPNASLGRLIGLFGTAANPRGQLARRLGPTVADSDVFVYFSGHGFPGVRDHKGYLLPIDADARDAEDTGYSLDVLTENLGKLGARSVTLVLDACFSGDSAAGPLLKDKSVMVRPADPPPPQPRLTVLAAAGPDEMANWDRPDRHGAFTEFFLRAVYGAADDPAYGGRRDGRVTAAAVKRYLDAQMSRWTARELDSDQTATLSGVPGAILAAFSPGHPPPRPDVDGGAASSAANPPPVVASPVLLAPPARAPAPGEQSIEVGAYQQGALIEKVRRCWDPPRGGSEGLSVHLVVMFDERGIARSAEIGPDDQARASDDARFRAFAETVRRAVLTPRCASLPIPATDLGQKGVLSFRFKQ